MICENEYLPNLPASKLLELSNKVGNTPLQSLSLIIKGRMQSIHLKLESANPTGSMKDRTGYALIQHLQEQGRLNADSIIVESTSGNLGVALALQCKARGYGLVVVVDPRTTRENMDKMEALGARLDIVRQPDVTGGYLLSRLARVNELCAQQRYYVWTDQYASSANPAIHYTTTAPEIYQQMGGNVGAIFVPVSTGGTLSGIGRFFREVSPTTHIIGVDAYGSVVFGTPAAPRRLTGIGSSRPSSFLSKELYTSFILVKDEEAFAFCRALDAALHLQLGGSSGAVLAACVHYLAQHPTLTNVVCVCADQGTNYASSIFNDEWLEQQGICLARHHLGWLDEIVP